MSTPDTIHGKQLEKFIKDAFKPLEATLPIQLKRVMDSAGAGNLIQKADGDFELYISSGELGKPFKFSIECKASKVSSTFSENFRSLLKTDQVAKMRKQARLGACGIYVFEAVRLAQIEIWYAPVVNAMYYEKRKPLTALPPFTISKANFNEFARQWCEKPVGFMSELLRRAGE